MQWCSQGASIEAVREEISSCTTIESLRHIYAKHEVLKQLIKPLVIKRKAEIESAAHIIDNKNIIQTSNSQNGTDLNT